MSLVNSLDKSLDKSLDNSLDKSFDNKIFEMMRPEEVNVVIYHSPCSDGTGSGYIAWKFLSENFPEREVKYHPASIGANPPNDLGKKFHFKLCFVP